MGVIMINLDFMKCDMGLKDLLKEVKELNVNFTISFDYETSGVQFKINNNLFNYKIVGTELSYIEE